MVADGRPVVPGLLAQLVVQGGGLDRAEDQGLHVGQLQVQRAAGGGHAGGRAVVVDADPHGLQHRAAGQAQPPALVVHVEGLHAPGQYHAGLVIEVAEDVLPVGVVEIRLIAGGPVHLNGIALVLRAPEDVRAAGAPVGLLARGGVQHPARLHGGGDAAEILHIPVQAIVAEALLAEADAEAVVAVVLRAHGLAVPVAEGEAQRLPLRGRRPVRHGIAVDGDAHLAAGVAAGVDGHGHLAVVGHGAFVERDVVGVVIAGLHLRAGRQLLVEAVIGHRHTDEIPAEKVILGGEDIAVALQAQMVAAAEEEGRVLAEEDFAVVRAQEAGIVQIHLADAQVAPHQVLRPQDAVGAGLGVQDVLVLLHPVDLPEGEGQAAVAQRVGGAQAGAGHEEVARQARLLVPFVPGQVVGLGVVRQGEAGKAHGDGVHPVRVHAVLYIVVDLEGGKQGLAGRALHMGQGDVRVVRAPDPDVHPAVLRRDLHLGSVPVQLAPLVAEDVLFQRGLERDARDLDLLRGQVVSAVERQLMDGGAGVLVEEILDGGVLIPGVEVHGPDHHPGFQVFGVHLSALVVEEGHILAAGPGVHLRRARAGEVDALEPHGIGVDQPLEFRLRLALRLRRFFGGPGEALHVQRLGRTGQRPCGERDGAHKQEQRQKQTEPSSDLHDRTSFFIWCGLDACTVSPNRVLRILYHGNHPV